jgi:hypothetical protein
VALMLRPPDGYVPIPGSKSGGYHKPKPGGDWDYWYPSAHHAYSEGRRRKEDGDPTGDAITAHYEAMGNVDVGHLRAYLANVTAGIEAGRDHAKQAHATYRAKRMAAAKEAARVANAEVQLQDELNEQWTDMVDQYEWDDDDPPYLDVTVTEEEPYEDGSFSYEPHEFEAFEKALLEQVPPGEDDAGKLKTMQDRVRGSAARVAAAFAQRDTKVAEAKEAFASVVEKLNTLMDHASETYEALWDEVSEQHTQQWHAWDESGDEDADEPEFEDERDTPLSSDLDPDPDYFEADSVEEFLKELRAAPMPPMPLAKGRWGYRPIDVLQRQFEALRVGRF